MYNCVCIYEELPGITMIHVIVPGITALGA